MNRKPLISFWVFFILVLLPRGKDKTLAAKRHANSCAAEGKTM
jgi:hypothetical protein